MSKADTIYERIAKAARGRVEKSGRDVSEDTAIAEFITKTDDGRRLWGEYAAEQSAATASAMLDDSDLTQIAKARDDAWSAIEALGRRVQKDDPSLSNTAAIDRAMQLEEGRELYRRYANGEAAPRTAPAAVHKAAPNLTAAQVSFLKALQSDRPMLSKREQIRKSDDLDADFRDLIVEEEAAGRIVTAARVAKSATRVDWDTAYAWARTARPDLAQAYDRARDVNKSFDLELAL